MTKCWYSYLYQALAALVDHKRLLVFHIDQTSAAAVAMAFHTCRSSVAEVFHTDQSLEEEAFDQASFAEDNHQLQAAASFVADATG